MISARAPKRPAIIKRPYRAGYFLSQARRILQAPVPFKRPGPPSPKLDSALLKPPTSPINVYPARIGFTPSPKQPSPKGPPQIVLPNVLATPVIHDVDREPMVTAYPELKPIPTEYIRRGLKTKGTLMLDAVAAVHAAPPKDKLPKEINVPLNDAVAAACPTHMLAVYSQPTAHPTSPPPKRRRVTLYPAHSLVFTSHCSNAPVFPRALPERPKEGTINLPVVPLGLPSADTFPLLQRYLYTKRIDTLFSSILPIPPEEVRPGLILKDVIDRHSEVLGEAYDVPTLLRYAARVNGLWRNACCLAVYDDKLWGAIHMAWCSIIGAIQIIRTRSPSP